MRFFVENLLIIISAVNAGINDESLLGVGRLFCYVAVIINMNALVLSHVTASGFIPMIIIVRRPRGFPSVLMSRLGGRLVFLKSAYRTGKGLNTVITFGRLGGDYSFIEGVISLASRLFLCAATNRTAVPMRMLVIGPYIRKFVIMRIARCLTAARRNG